MRCIVLDDPARDPRDFQAAAGLRSFLLRDLDAGPARDTRVARASPCRVRRQDDSAHRPEPAG